MDIISRGGSLPEWQNSLCVFSGDHRIWPEHLYSLLLSELRLQSGPWIHWRLHLPLHEIQRPKRDARRRSIPQANGRSTIKGFGSVLFCLNVSSICMWPCESMKSIDCSLEDSTGELLQHCQKESYTWGISTIFFLSFFFTHSYSIVFLNMPSVERKVFVK